MLVAFDDPWYWAHVRNPSFFTYAVAEFGTALFVAGLLIFWLRDIARHRSPEPDAGATKLQKFLHRSMGMNKWIGAFLVFLFVLLVTCFTALYCVFYWAVAGDPGAGEISVN